MSLTDLTTFFGWCTVLNFGLLLLSGVGLTVCGKAIAKFHSRLLGLEESTLVPAYFRYIAQFKIAAITLSFVPYLALKIMAS